MGLLIPFVGFGISVGVLLIWGFRAKKKAVREHSADVRPQKAA
jgi:hypothetical protein